MKNIIQERRTYKISIVTQILTEQISSFNYLGKKINYQRDRHVDNKQNTQAKL